MEVVARVEPDPHEAKQAMQVTADPDSAWHASLEQALGEVEADAVLATVAIPAHAEVALTALRAGKHVLLEKPFAPTLDEARQVVAEAERRGLVVAVAQNYRFLPAAPIVAEVVRSGAIGRVDRGRVDFRKDHPTDYRRATSPLDHSYLSQIAIHHFDLMRAILGREAARICCRAWNAPWMRGLGTVTAAALVELAGGGVISYGGSLRSTGAETSWAADWHLEGEHGEVSWHAGADGGDVVETRPREGEPRLVTVPPPPHGSERAALLARFAEAVRDGAEPPSSGRDNLRSLAMMTAAIESSETGRPVDVAAV